MQLGISRPINTFNRKTKPYRFGIMAILSWIAHHQPLFAKGGLGVNAQ